MASSFLRLSYSSCSSSSLKVFWKIITFDKNLPQNLVKPDENVMGGLHAQLAECLHGKTMNPEFDSGFAHFLLQSMSLTKHN